MRFFTTAGPIKPARHYCIPPLERLDLDAVLALIRDEPEHQGHNKEKGRLC